MIRWMYDAADAGLQHGGRVDVDLQFRLPTGAAIGFVFRRNRHDEHVPAIVHRRIDFAWPDETAGCRNRGG